MAFDPDAFLNAQEPKRKQFDPDSFLGTSKPKESPSFGQRLKQAAVPELVQGRAGATTRGLISGFVGGPGELEKFGAYTAPRMFGFEAPPQEFLGRETLFPTMTEVQRGLSAVGFPETQRQYKPIESVSEVLGGFASLAPAAGRTLRSALDTNLVRGLMGKRTKEAQAQLGRQTGELGGTVSRQLADIASEEQRLLARARAAQQQRLGQIVPQEEAALRAGQKAERAPESALRELAGVRTVEEAGRLRPVPQTPSQVGDFIRQQADTFATNIKAARNTKADQLFSEATEAAFEAQQVGRFVDTQPIVNQIDDLIAQGGTKDYMDSLIRLKDDVTRTRNFEGLEVIRRKLGDASFGSPEEGYKAISQQFAGNMRDALTTQMRQFADSLEGAQGAGAFSRYLDEYKRLSEPLRVYGTRVGRGILETEDVGGRYVSKSSEKLAREMFSSPENYQKFVDAVGGNKQIAEAAARRYFAGLMETARTPVAVEKIFRENRALLDQIPTIRNEIAMRYLPALRRAEAVGQAAPKVVQRAKESAVEVQRQFKAIDDQVSARMGNIAKAKTLFSDSVKALRSVDPNKILETFDNNVLTKIRAAEDQAGRRLLSDAQVDALRRQVEQVQEIADTTRRNRIIATTLATVLGLQRAATTTGQLTGE